MPESILEVNTITAPNDTLDVAIQRHIDLKTKPIGALGKLETTAAKIAKIQQTLTPMITHPHAVVFAGDHGIADEGVSPFPKAVTTQMVLNFLQGGAAINTFCNLHHIPMQVVNAGIESPLDAHPQLINMPVASGTHNYLHQAAMSEKACAQAMQAGADYVKGLAVQKCDLLILGEMGISNTSSAALIMSEILQYPLAQCIGKGTGLDDVGLARKLDVLTQARHRLPASPLPPLTLLAEYGGFEIAMLVGACLEAAQQGMVILVDGFIVTAALLIAHAIHPHVVDYCIASHCSDEAGHKAMLKHLNLSPLLQLDMRLGEGSGAAVAYPIVQASLAFFNHMASFESANVSNRDA